MMCPRLALLLALVVVAPCCVAQLATCGDKDGDGGGTDAVSDADCLPSIYNPGSAAAHCAGATCDASSSLDSATCCGPRATCHNKDGPGRGPWPWARVSDEDCGVGFIVNSANANEPCADPTGCNVDDSSADKATCCVAQATCGDKDGLGGGSDAVSDTECGLGLVYNAENAGANCAGVACNLDCRVGCADQATCCVSAHATCGDVSGVGGHPNARTTVSDEDCGAGLVYNAANADHPCANPTSCDIDGSAADKAACCRNQVATCGDKDGSGSSTSAVDCGGFLYDSAQADQPCADPMDCDVEGSASDKAACCVQASSISPPRDDSQALFDARAPSFAVDAPTTADQAVASWPAGNERTETLGCGSTAVAVGDFNADSRPDLFVANINCANDVLLGAGAGKFVSLTSGPAVAGSLSSVGAVVADFTGDSRDDIFVINRGVSTADQPAYNGGPIIAERNQMFVNDGAVGTAVNFVELATGPAVEGAASTRTSVAVTAADFDQDGW
eukprot:COSAG04_NODE_741_length_10670_cov_20.643837_3_plen_504_part_00